MASKPTLGYWDIRGLGAPIRYLLTYAGIDFEDKRYSDPNEWFGKDKPSLGLDFPNLPYYIDGSVKLTQTQAILRYIARKANLDGATEAEKIAISLVEQQVQDLNIGEKPFVAGSNISYADFWQYEYLKKISVLVPGALDATPNLAKFLVRIESLPQLSAFFKANKPALFNGPMAKWNATA
uniref:glutathione transferase n=1 Tax=Acarus siro TaxID=66546 RepID=B0KZJ2_ACASI|nr:allergen Aca s 8 [Acarus siro]